MMTTKKKYEMTHKIKTRMLVKFPVLFSLSLFKLFLQMAIESCLTSNPSYRDISLACVWSAIIMFQVSTPVTISARMTNIGWDNKVGVFDQFALNLELSVPPGLGHEALNISFSPGPGTQVQCGTVCLQSLYYWC